MFDFINQELDSLKKSGLYRQLKIIDPKKHLIFCSNDYLGLTNHPKIIEATKGLKTGSGASRLVSGNIPIHEELENKIAKFKKREAAIVFPTGYMANLGVISALTNEKDLIIIDRLNHASIIDGCRLSKAKLKVYPHKDMAALEKILQQSEKFKKKLIITDSVFSMDGDIAPLPQIVALAKKYNAITMIDEAHATGTIGKTGRGAEEYFGIEGQVDIVMGTLSKAIGSLGGFVAGKKELIDFLVNKSRSFIYTTALPPTCCAASIAAFEIIESNPGLIEQLKTNARLIKSDAKTPIIPILIGDAKKTMEISEKLFAKGIFVSGIRPPTVPEGKSRLRITVSAAHTKEEIECLLSSLQELIPR